MIYIDYSFSISSLANPVSSTIVGLFKNEMIYIMLEEDDEKRLERYDKLCLKILRYKIPIRNDRKYNIQRRPDNKNSYNKLKSF